MTLDWFTIAAQILNFLVLLYLLKRFLYPAIIRMMDKREQLIASRLKAAEDKMKQASEAEASYVLQKQELAAEREKLTAQAREDADKLRKELSEKARADVEADRARWRTAVEQQEAESMKVFRRRAAEQVVGIARRTLRDLADRELEQQIVARFIERLQSISTSEAGAIRKSLEKDGGTVNVASAFELPADMRQKILLALRTQAGDAVQVEYRTSPDLVSGIELTVGDIRIAWNLQSYLDDLEQAVSKAVEEAE